MCLIRHHTKCSSSCPVFPSSLQPCIPRSTAGLSQRQRNLYSSTKVVDKVENQPNSKDRSQLRSHATVYDGGQPQIFCNPSPHSCKPLSFQVRLYRKQSTRTTGHESTPQPAGRSWYTHFTSAITIDRPWLGVSLHYAGPGVGGNSKWRPSWNI